ncbi:MAG: hypothetical protein WCV55_01620 [Candidatus Paceibacterota bacterium]
MSTKSLVFIFMTIGSIIGGYIPMLWGEGSFSMSALVFSSIFAIVGIIVGFKIGQEMN